MKKALLLSILLTSLRTLFAQVPVLYYDFELNSNRNTFENAVEQYINPGNSALTPVGLSGVTGVAGAGTANGGPASGSAIDASGWSTSATDPGSAAADYYQFAINTSGFEGISIAFQAENENNGPDKVGVLWSTDGTNFTKTTTSDNLISTSWALKTFTLPANANNKSSVIIRIYAYSAKFSSRKLTIDNLLAFASSITSSKTLLDYSALGLSVTSGAAYQPALSGYTIDGNNTTVTLKSSLNITGSLVVDNASTLDCKAYSIVGTGTVTINDGGSLKIGSLNTTDAIKGNINTINDVVLADGSTVELNGAAEQYLSERTFSNLIINNNFGVTAKGNITASDVSLTTGNLDLSTTTCSISGQLSRSAGTFTTAGTLVFNGTGAQTIPANAVNGNLNNVTVNNSAGLTINGAQTISGVLDLTSGFLALNGQSLTLSGTVTGTGVLRGSVTSTIITTSAVGTLKMDGSTDGITNALGNVTVNGGSVTVGSKLHLFNVLTVSSGTFNANGQNIVFKSNSVNTARIAPLGATASITNATNITVERYFPNGGRRYRLVAPGVTTTTTMRANWMEGALNTAVGVNVDPAPGYGMQITGSAGNANGFDATQTNSTSMYTFNQATGGWASVTNTNVILSASGAYLAFIRGDRSTDMNSVANPLPSSATTLRATGTIKTGNQSLASLNNSGGFSLVANPFISPLSWTTIYSNNSTKFENYYTYWEPKIGSRGGYVTVTSSGLKSNSSSVATTEIQSGQAVFVKTKTGVTSPSLSIREQDKSTTSNINVFRTTSGPEQFFTSLFFNDAAGVRTLADGVLTAFNDAYSASVNDDDALQIANWDEDVAIMREGKALSIETRPSVGVNDTIYLSTNRLKIQAYEWQFEPTNLRNTELICYLIDNFANTQTVLNLASPTVVPFAVTADAASSASTRFMIVFKNIVVLPVNFTSIKANQQGSVNKIEWNTASEQNVLQYEVEKSTDGLLFSTIGQQLPKGGSANTYFAVDASPSAGNNFYRIKGIDASGSFTYSSVANVKMAGTIASVDVYPNPVIGNKLNLQLANLEKGKYIAELFSMAGQKVLNLSLEHAGGSSAQEIKLDNNLGKGVYQLRITGAGGQWTMRVLR